VISGFYREVDEIYDLLGCCAAYGSNSLPTRSGNPSRKPAMLLDLFIPSLGSIKVGIFQFIVALESAPVQ
jgi:hypothetical protein